MALIIGNSDYNHHTKLCGVEKDVASIVDLLRNQLGFEVQAYLLAYVKLKLVSLLACSSEA